MRRSKNCAPMPSVTSNDQTRARIRDAGEYAPYARNAASLSTIFTVSPAAGSPSTRATAPENSHGWRRRNDLSRPGLTTSTGTAADTGWLSQRDAEKVSDGVRDCAGDGAERKHASAGKHRAPSGEQRQRRADAEQRHGGDADRRRQRSVVGRDQIRQEWQQRARRE